MNQCVFIRTVPSRIDARDDSLLNLVASKFAAEGLTMAMARELDPQNIRVNAIRPGFVNCDRMAGFRAKQAKLEGATPEAFVVRGRLENFPWIYPNARKELMFVLLF